MYRPTDTTCSYIQLGKCTRNTVWSTNGLCGPHRVGNHGVWPCMTVYGPWGESSEFITISGKAYRDFLSFSLVYVGTIRKLPTILGKAIWVPLYDCEQVDNPDGWSARSTTPETWQIQPIFCMFANLRFASIIIHTNEGRCVTSN